MPRFSCETLISGNLLDLVLGFVGIEDAWSCTMGISRENCPQQVRTANGSPGHVSIPRVKPVTVDSTSAASGGDYDRLIQSIGGDLTCVPSAFWKGK